MNLEKREATVGDITILSDLIETFNLGKRKYGTKFYKKQKINFAYNFYNEIGNVSILDVLKKAIDTNSAEERKKIVGFIGANGLTRKLPDMNNEYNDTFKFYAKDLSKESTFHCFAHRYDQHNWLEEYDIDFEYGCDNIRIKSPTIISMLDKNGNRVIIDKEMAQKIKTVLTQNNIFPAHQIVKLGFGPYIKEEFNEYIDEVKKGVIK